MIKLRDLGNVGERRKDTPVSTKGLTAATPALAPPNLYFKSRGNSQADASVTEFATELAVPPTDEKFSLVYNASSSILDPQVIGILPGVLKYIASYPMNKKYRCLTRC